MPTLTAQNWVLLKSIWKVPQISRKISASKTAIAYFWVGPSFRSTIPAFYFLFWKFSQIWLPGVAMAVPQHFILEREEAWVVKYQGGLLSCRYDQCSEPFLSPIVFFSWQGSRKRRKLQKLWEPWWVCSLSAGCPSLSQTSLVSKISVSLVIIIPIVTDSRPKPAYGQQGLEWDCGVRIQFRRVHFGVFSTSRAAFSALSSHCIGY